MNWRLRVKLKITDFLGFRHHHLQFKYNDPYPNFDRSRVKGVVAKLIRVKDPKYTAAIEVVAGGKVGRALEKLMYRN